MTFQAKKIEKTLDAYSESLGEEKELRAETRSHSHAPTSKFNPSTT